jgi:uncharacterized membrane protein YfcA
MHWIDWIILPAVGAVGGFLAGLLGVGGGIIFVPLLTWYLHKLGIQSDEIVKFTLANSIFLVVVSGLAGIYRQKKSNAWDYKRAFAIGIPGAAVAWIWSYFIESGTWYSKERFQTVFLGFLLISIGNMIFGKSAGQENQEQASSQLGWKETLVGMLAGSVVSLSGLGGGVIMVPLFRMLLKMPMRKATALSLSIIPMLGLFPLLNYAISTPQSQSSIAHTGYIVWPLAIPISLGVAIFASLGVKSASKVPVLWLRIIFALMSAGIFIKTLSEIINK